MRLSKYDRQVRKMELQAESTPEAKAQQDWITSMTTVDYRKKTLDKLVAGLADRLAMNTSQITREWAVEDPNLTVEGKVDFITDIIFNSLPYLLGDVRKLQRNLKDMDKAKFSVIQAAIELAKYPPYVKEEALAKYMAQNAVGS